MLECATRRSEDFLLEIESALWRQHGIRLPAPTIASGPDGSVDLHWLTPDFELLICIPADIDSPAEFYGDDYKENCIKGAFRLSTIHDGILSWLAGRIRGKGEAR